MVGTRARFARLLVRALVVVVPIVVVPALASLSVGFLARRGAAVLLSLGSRVPAATPPELELATLSDVAPAPRESAVVAVAEVRQRSGPRKDGAPGRRGARRIYVGPDLIRRAVPVSGRPAASWTNRGDDRPAGMLISNPGALAGTIQAGDIVFEAEGRSLESFEQLVAIVGQAYQRRAKVVSGRLWRRGEAWILTVEPGWGTDELRGRD
jgi:hypothetical protein